MKKSCRGIRKNGNGPLCTWKGYKERIVLCGLVLYFRYSIYKYIYVYICIFLFFLLVKFRSEAFPTHHCLQKLLDFFPHPLSISAAAPPLPHPRKLMST